MHILHVVGLKYHFYTFRVAEALVFAVVRTVTWMSVHWGEFNNNGKKKKKTCVCVRVWSVPSVACVSEYVWYVVHI